MRQENKKKIVVAGGGTAGWMAACALARKLNHFLDITLVESDDIGSIGVGEATIPTMQSFHHLLEIDEQEFLRETKATFKLGIEFENWSKPGSRYFHSFGETGRDFWAGQFQHFWLRSKRQGYECEFSDFSVEAQAAKLGKFAKSQNPHINYAYHLDATLYARYLRKLSEQEGVQRIEGRIDAVGMCPSSGNIKSLTLASGVKIEADFFIDCTGFSGLLIDKALHVGYEDWSDVFLCDRAVAVQTRTTGEPTPYTRSVAEANGWRWRIPLQHRMGNGFVYSSKYMSDEDARQLLLDNIEGECISEPRLIRFRPGRRKKVWHKNCVAIGLASGFIEPLESTSIHLISSSIIRLLRMFPVNEINDFDIAEFNSQAISELETTRDFVALHYKSTERSDSEFWRYCKNMEVSPSLSARMSMYADAGRIHWGSDELFTVNSWNQVMLGQGIMPKAYHPAADVMSDEEFEKYFVGYRASLLNFVKQLPSHAEFIGQYCAVPEEAVV